MKKICVSVLSADFSRLGEEIKELESAGADIIHCDIMDGHFVPNITFGMDIVRAINKITYLPLDVHLMIDNADGYIDSFADAGADYISVHIENNYHINRLIHRIKSLGIKAGVVLNPSTNISVLEYLVEYIDFVLVMSVNPGFGGQKFISNSVNKIKELKNLFCSHNSDCLIQVDGGIGTDNIKLVSDAGADMIVCGASIFKSPDRVSAVRELKSLIR